MTIISARVYAALLRCFLIGCPAPALAAAQQAATAPVESAAIKGEPGSELTVYLMTMGPGDAVWEKFGHNAIWIRGASGRLDVAYNWGLFDFNDADFLPRFLKGSMRYWMGGYSARQTVEAYAGYNRSVWAQELAMTPAQKLELLEFVQWNERPENRFYHYDYFRDNCSTRVRDALDRVLGGQIRTKLDSIATGTTYRWHTRRLTEENIPMYIGMDIVLGPNGDTPITAWEEAFLPMSLRDYIQPLEIPGPHGDAVPLVASESLLFAATRAPEPAAPASRLLVFLIAGAILGASFALAAARSTGSRSARIVGAVLGSAWSTIAGLMGTVMLLSWILTDHFFMYRNENLLQLSPLSLVLAALLPALMLGGRRTTFAWRASVAIAALSVIGFVLQALPGLDQVNGEVIALALPIHLGVAWGAGRLAKGETERERRSLQSSV